MFQLTYSGCHYDGLDALKRVKRVGVMKRGEGQSWFGTFGAYNAGAQHVTRIIEDPQNINKNVKEHLFSAGNKEYQKENRILMIHIWI
jgi:hypothetical protein